MIRSLDTCRRLDVGIVIASASIQQKYPVHADVSGGKGFCVRVSNDAASRENSMNMFLKQWAASNIESINTNWTNQ